MYAFYIYCRVKIGLNHQSNCELLLATSVKTTILWAPVKRLLDYYPVYVSIILLYIYATISVIYGMNGIIISACIRKADGTLYKPSDDEKKAMLLFKEGEDMKTLFQHAGKVLDTSAYEQAVRKISDGLSERTNKVVQRNMLLSDFPQGSKSFKKWSQEVRNAAKLINYDNYGWQEVAVDAIIPQTSNAALCEQALQENVTYDQLLKMGIVKEQSAKRCSTS